jgi:hypothetical protein
VPAGDRDVGADPYSDFSTSDWAFHPRRGGGDGDDQAYPEREPQRDEDDLPHPAAQFPPQVGDEEHDLRSR